MKKVKEMTGNEKIAYRNTKYAVQHIVGGYENSVTDGYMEEMPTYEDLEDEVYEATTTGTFGDGFMSVRPIKEVKFAGEKFIREVIRYFFDKEGFEYPVKHRESQPAQPEKKKEEKVYISIVRNKENLRTAKFEIVKIQTTSKKLAEDILFDANLAPFGNKIYTEEQFSKLTKEHLEEKGIEDIKAVVEKARYIGK